MFEIRNNFLRITKGDAASIKVNLTNADGSPYTMQTGDKLVMTVKKRPDTASLLSVNSTTNTLTITSAASKNLEIGECCFDIELQRSNGYKYTVVGMDEMRSNMFVYPEVTA